MYNEYVKIIKNNLIVKLTNEYFRRNNFMANIVVSKINYKTFFKLFNVSLLIFLILSLVNNKVVADNGNKEISTKIQYIAPLNISGTNSTSNGYLKGKDGKSFDPFRGSSYQYNPNDNLGEKSMKVAETMFDKNATVEGLGQLIITKLTVVLNIMIKIFTILSIISLIISIGLFAIGVIYRRLRWAGFVSAFSSLLAISLLASISKIVSMAMNFFA